MNTLKQQESQKKKIKIGGKWYGLSVQSVTTEVYMEINWRKTFSI